MRFAERIRKYRLEKNYTQEELAKVLFVSKKTVSKWETGRGMPDPSLLPHIARALGVTIDDLFEDKAEAESFYGVYHKEVDEHALYVESYQKQRTVTAVWKCICATICVVAVVFGAFFLKYYQGYQSLLLHAERILYWKDYSKEDSEWQSYKINGEISYVIEAEQNASVLVALQELVYRADGSLVTTKTFIPESHDVYVDGKLYQVAQGLPNEYFTESIPELNKERGQLGPNVRYCQSTGWHYLDYRRLGSKYFGATYIRVHIPEDEREELGIQIQTDTGEKLTKWSPSGAFSLRADPREVLHGKNLQALRFGTYTKDPLLVIESLGERGIMGFSKEQQEAIAEAFGGGRVNIIYQNYYEEWRDWTYHHQGEYVCRIRVEFIGSTEYKNLFFDFDFCMTD